MKRRNLLKFGAFAFSLCLGAGVFALNPAVSSAQETTPTCDIVGKTLSLKDNVYIRYVVDFNNTLETDETGVLVWTAPQEVYEYSTANTVLTEVKGNATNTDGETFPAYSYTNLSAKQMTETVYASPYIERDGVYYYGEVEKYSILQYAYNTLGYTEKTATTDEDLTNLLNAMLNYGAMAQVYHKYNPDYLATDNFTYVKIENATFEDGFNYGLFKAGEEVKFSIPDGYQLRADLPEYIRVENSENILTVPTEKVILSDLVVETPKYSQGLKYTLLSNDTYAVSEIGTCTDTDIIIPDTYNGKAVTSIGYEAFDSCYNLTSVILPNSITSIGENAFWSCQNLTSATIPDSVTSIGSGAFFNCRNLTSVTIGNVTSIKPGTFYYCLSLTNITIPNSVKTIDAQAFEGCSNLRNASIPDSVTTIGDSAFKHCNSLGVNIPNSVTTISKEAFAYCYALRNVIIPDSVKTIGDSAFFNCPGLTNVTIGNSVTSIGKEAFYCYDLSSVNFKNPNGWTAGTTKLSAIDLANPTISATYLKDTYSSSTWTRKESQGLKYTYIKYSDSYQVSGIGTCTDTDLIIPKVHDEKPVTSIGYDAFKSCENLISVIIPNSVTSIGSFAFDCCYNLTSVVLPNSITSIGEGAFWACTSLTNITIPNSVTSIGIWAFVTCTSLTDIIIPDSVTSIGQYAFYDCENLSNVTFENPNGWTADTIQLSATDLTNTTTSATYLKSTYYSSTWTRS